MKLFIFQNIYEIIKITQRVTRYETSFKLSIVDVLSEIISVFNRGYLALFFLRVLSLL